MGCTCMYSHNSLAILDYLSKPTTTTSYTPSHRYNTPITPVLLVCHAKHIYMYMLYR